MNLPVRVAVIFVNYGAYHRVRARALQSRSELEPHFIELASAQALYPWHATASADAVTVTPLSHGQYEQLPKIRIVRAIWQHLHALQPDVVVGAGYSEPPMLAAALWAKLHRRRYVLMFETNEWDRPRPPWQALVQRSFLRSFVDGVFCGGTAHHQYLRKLGVPQRRIWDRYDVVDNAYFASASDVARAHEEDQRRVLGLPPRYFLYVGRFSPEKNLEVLLRAYARYRDGSDGSCGLVMVGSGSRLAELKQLAAGLQLREVVWAGPQGIEQLPIYYALASAFVLPSRVEPWGLVVNEAMACGLPVIVSNRCGCALDLVRENVNGWTFEPEDAGALAAWLAKMACLDRDAHARMAEASRRVVADFSPEAWAANLSACCLSLS